MLKKLIARARKYKKPLLVGLAVIALLVGGGFALHAKHESDKKKAEKANHKQGGKDVQSIQKPSIYTFESSDVSCKDVKLTPKGDDTATLCSGTADLVDSKTKKTSTFTVSSSTHLYKGQTEIPIEQFNDIPKGKAFSLTTFTGKDNKTLANVVYSE